MASMERRHYGTLIQAKSIMVLCFIMMNCLVLQVQGGSIFEITVPESAPQSYGCNYDREWIELYPGAGIPTCINDTWVCPHKGQCESFTFHHVNSIYYFCGPCGGLGSRCKPSEGLVCNRPGTCSDHGWCRCKDRDYVRGGLCQKNDPVGLTPDFYVLLIVFILILLINKIIKSGKTFRDLWNQRRICCCCLNSSGSDSDDETSIVGVNERAGEKTASYTMGNNDFMATFDDPDLEWALELSRTMRQPNGEWIEGTVSVRVRPSTFNRSQRSNRRSIRSIQSVEHSLERPSQAESTSVISTDVEDSNISQQLETNSLSNSITNESESVKCTRHQEYKCTASTSISHECTPSTSISHEYISSASTSHKSTLSASLSNECTPSTSTSPDCTPSTSTSHESTPSTSTSHVCTSSTSTSHDCTPSTSTSHGLDDTQNNSDNDGII